MPRLTESAKPTFGQVWEWNGSKMMLITPGKESGEWVVGFIYEDGVSTHGLDKTMHGLHDDPKRRIDGYTLLSEDI